MLTYRRKLFYPWRAMGLRKRTSGPDGCPSLFWLTNTLSYGVGLPCAERL